MTYYWLVNLKQWKLASYVADVHVHAIYNTYKTTPTQRTSL